MSRSSLLVLALVLSANSLAAAGQTDRGDLRVMLVGQALVKKDLRVIAPASVTQALLDNMI